MKKIVHRSKLAAVTGAWMAVSIPSFAMTQCPHEFGPKNPSVNAFGWLIVILGVALGGALVTYAIKRTQGMGLAKRTISISLAILGLVISSFIGLAVAIAFFFLKC